MCAKILQGPPLDGCPNTSVGQFFFDSAKKFADRICQIDGRTDKKQTFATVNQKSVRVALEMQKRGITSDDAVVMCTSVDLDTPIPIIGCFYLGAKVVNLDTTQSVRQNAHLLSIVCPKMIFVSESFVDVVEQSLKESKVGSSIVVFGKSIKYPTFSDFDQPKPNEQDFKPVEVDLNDTIVMFFSSGTTGLPKAICHSHKSFLRFSFTFYNIGAKFDSILSVISFYWMSVTSLLACSFIGGGHRVLMESTATPEEMFTVLEKYKITFWFVTPISTYELTSFENYQKYNTSSLHTILTGGTRLSTSQFLRVCNIFKHATFLFAYGQTEVGMITSFNVTSEKKQILKKIGSSGKPAAGITLKFVDTETRQLLGPNQKGEIYVKSGSTMKEYYKAENESSKLWDKEGFLKTGDLGYYDEDGCCYIIERIGEMFKYIIFHIVPSAIESVLLEHPDIAEAVVFGLPQGRPEEGEVPTACVVLKKDRKVTGREIEDFVAKIVSDSEKLRGGVVFLQELMKTPSGKLKRREIRDHALNILNKNRLQ